MLQVVLRVRVVLRVQVVLMVQAVLMVQLVLRFLNDLDVAGDAEHTPWFRTKTKRSPWII